jgi:hypothetical protein
MDMLQTILDIFHPDKLERDDSEKGAPQHFPQTLLPEPQGRARQGTAMGHIYAMLRSDTEAATEFRNLPSPSPWGPSLTAQGGNAVLGFAQAYALSQILVKMQNPLKIPFSGVNLIFSMSVCRPISSNRIKHAIILDEKGCTLLKNQQRDLQGLPALVQLIALAQARGSGVSKSLPCSSNRQKCF